MVVLPMDILFHRVSLYLDIPNRVNLFKFLSNNKFKFAENYKSLESFGAKHGLVKVRYPRCGCYCRINYMYGVKHGETTIYNKNRRKIAEERYIFDDLVWGHSHEGGPKNRCLNNYIHPDWTITQKYIIMQINTS